jgi:hypothetical protein
VLAHELLRQAALILAAGWSKGADARLTRADAGYLVLALPGIAAPRISHLVEVLSVGKPSVALAGVVSHSKARPP